jgi:hypothetical protein
VAFGALDEGVVGVSPFDETCHRYLLPMTFGVIGKSLLRADRVQLCVQKPVLGMKKRDSRFLASP